MSIRTNYSILAIQTVNPGIRDRGFWVWKPCLNRSPGNQLMMIKLHQEVFEAGIVLENPEVLVIKRIEDPKETEKWA